MNNRRPRILVTRPDEPERWETYARHLEALGAEPLRGEASAWRADGAPAFDALLLTGGVDIEPARYGEQPHETVQDTSAERDDFESTVLADALARDVPVLAICRGHQLFNVAHGGSLLQHLEEREPHRARRNRETGEIDSGWHEVEVVPGSRLANILGAERVRTNSRHHQAVTPERVAPGLAVVATTEDGVVEALEAPERRWALSVQWHPERDELAAESTALFEAFVDAARAGRPNTTPSHPDK